MKRTPSRELLDSDAGTPKEIAGSLADLRLVNRWFGGIRTTRHLLRRTVAVCGLRRISMLEVAAGSGDVPLATQRALQADGIDISITALDQSAAHLPPHLPSVVADALALPFPDDSFDVVSCGLFAHHLSPEDVVRFASEAIRVSRRAAIINDLIRHPIHLLLVYAGMPLYRSRLTRNDAPASVRQAYTLDEMQTMLKLAPAARVEITRHYLFRMGVIAWKRL